MESSDYIAAQRPAAARHVRTVWVVSTLALFAIIAYLTLMPVPHMPRSSAHWDKIAHLVAFLALVLPTAALRPRAMAWVAVLAIGFGAAIELIQPYVGRSAELLDLVADAAGVGLGLLIGSVLRRRVLDRRA